MLGQVFQRVVLLHSVKNIVEGHIGADELPACGAVRIVVNPSDIFHFRIDVEFIHVVRYFVLRFILDFGYRRLYLAENICGRNGLLFVDDFPDTVI